MLTNLFYIINFSLAIIVATIAIIVGLLTIIIFIINRQCRTITNLMASNTAAATIFYFIICYISSIHGLQDDWATYQPACVVRAYCHAASSAAICYSHLMHAISRLFCVIFYKHKFLLTWRVHCLMIIVNWLISVTVTILPLFVNDAYGLEQESRICTITSKIFFTSMYTAIVVYLIPFSIIVIIYTTILYKTHQSTRRVMPLAARTTITVVTTSHIPRPNIKREIKLIKIMLILIGALTCAGALYLILSLWQGIRPEPSPPKPLYLLSLNAISISAALMAVALFWVNQDIKKCAFKYLQMLF